MSQSHDSVRIQDNRSATRKSLLKKWFNNNYDALRFFYFLAQQTGLPILGKYYFRPLIESYYHHFEPGSLILPRKEIEAVIDGSSHLFVDPCICRIFNDNCDAPIFNCLRINFAAEIRREETGKGIDKAQALMIVKNARKHGLVFSLEQCIRPYQYNICMCCSCCCVPRQFRYEFGLDVYKPGPYLPEPDSEKCQVCKLCENACPVSVIRVGDGNVDIDFQACLGCGVCEDTCPNGAITMVKKRRIQRDEREPGRANLFLKRLFIDALMIPSVLVFKWLRGSQQPCIADSP